MNRDAGQTLLASLPTGPKRVWVALAVLSAVRVGAVALFFFTPYGVTGLGQWLLVAAFAAVAVLGTDRAAREPDAPHSVAFRYVLPASAVPFLIDRNPLVPMFVIGLLCLASCVAGRRSPRHRATWLTILVVTAALLLLPGVVFLSRLSVVTHASPADAASPDGSFVAKAYYYETGAWGRNEWWVRVEPRFLPLAFKEVYLGSDDETPTLVWRGPLSLTVRGKDVPVLGATVQDFPNEALP